MKLPNLAKISSESIQSAYMEWMAKNPPEVIKEKCLKTLDDSREDILRALLGFEKDDWNRNTWKVDHCNGRAGESAAGDYFRKHQQDTIDYWLSQVKMPSMTPSMKKEMEAHAHTTFTRVFKDKLENQVAAYAATQAKAFFDTVIESQKSKVDAQMRLLSLIAQGTEDLPCK